MCCGRHAVVAFLNSPEELRGVDRGFRPLVETLHTIPHCASFGVSCAGHLHAEPDKDQFWPRMHPHLNFMIVPELPHLARLRDLIGQVVSETPGATFRHFKHPFGPPLEYPVQAWRIEADDNSCLAPLGEYFGEVLKISENRAVFEAARERHEELDHLWVRLTQEVRQFCRRHGFTKFDLDQRVRELMRVWEMARAEDRAKKVITHAAA